MELITTDITYTDGKEQAAFNAAVKKALLETMQVVNANAEALGQLAQATQALSREVAVVKQELAAQKQRVSRVRNRLYDLEDE